VVAGVSLHGWAPEFARAPYYHEPYSPATPPPQGEVRSAPEAVPAPLAQAPNLPAPPSDAAPPTQDGEHGPAHHPALPAVVNRPAQLLGLTPSAVAFAAQQVGTSAAARVVTVASAGSAPLHVRGVAVSGGDVTAFAVVADHCSGVTLNPGGSCPVSVAFTPDGDGTRSATLTIDGDGARPATTTLSGVAVDAPITAQGLAVDCGQSTSTRCVIDAIFRQLLNRRADDAALQYYATQLDSGQTTRQQVAVAVQATDEWRAREVTLLFEALLRRAPDAASVAYYVPQLRAGSVDDVVAGIAGSQEYFTRAGATNDGFVTAVYKDLLRRAPDATGRAAWVDQLNRGGSRQGMALTIRRTAEAKALAVEAAVKQLLGRSATAAERNDLSNAMVHGVTDQQMVASLIQTDEYLARVVPLALTDAAVASFVDADPKGNAGQFTATVDWGDGTQPSTATVKRSKGGFVVLGSHTYATHRTWTATIHIVDVGGSTTTTTTTVVV